MICPRCKNQDSQYFYTFKNITYCRKCVKIGSTCFSPSRSPSIIKTVDYQLDYELTPLQNNISRQLLQRYQQHLNTSLKAVCGAGKTEITYEVIKYALNQGQRVCFTTPRKELVIELAKRLQSQFKNISITTVYGGHSELVDGQFIICTTHQLYRYPQYFDLLILDELDAFPYVNNEVLIGLLQNSIKGNYIYMSATLTNQPDLLMTKRYHGYLLDVPKCYLTSSVVMYLWGIKKIRDFVRKKKPVLVYVPTIQLTNTVARIFKLFKLKSHAISSNTKDIQKFIERLRHHQLDVLVTTTILERGITIDNVQVIILYGNNRIYTTATLIQICGRVGRKTAHPSGSISIFTPYKTRAIKECLKTIKQDNA